MDFKSKLVKREGSYTFDRIMCADGFSMSVQGHFGAYCYPRKNLDSADGYSEFELGFPSEKEELIMNYAETPSDPTNTVYGYVPDSVVQSVIDKHGGLIDRQ